MEIRRGTAQDAKEVHDIVKESSLDDNSLYMYLVMFSFYKEFSRVAIIDGKVAGFVLGFPVPQKRMAYFCWQIGVDKNHRGKGIAKKLLLSVTEGFRELWSTVTPSNKASNNLFESFTQVKKLKLHKEDMFSRSLFGLEADHEKEILYRIHP